MRDSQEDLEKDAAQETETRVANRWHRQKQSSDNGGGIFDVYT